MSGVIVERWQWLPAWLGGAAIGVANGATRELTYGKRLGEGDANRISALTGIAAFAVLFAALQRRWPLARRSEAVTVGGAWLLLTIGFEFGFGRAVAKKSWSELGGEYDLRRGRLWPLVLLAIATGPALAREAAQR
jgi:hypothetical protein